MVLYNKRSFNRHMLSGFKRYKGIMVLTYFLEHPTKEIHIKELARVLKVSSATSKHFCDLFAREQILLSEQKSNSVFFRLNNSSEYVTEMKRFYTMTVLTKSFQLKQKDGIFNVVVYGSYASGEYLERSDVDILIISRKKDYDDSFISSFQKKIKREVNVTKMTFIEWNKSKEREDAFTKEIIKNNFSLFGGKLQ